MSKNQLVLSVRWMLAREVVVCGFFNRISRRPKVKTFFVMISELGDGIAWYALILALPFVYGQGGVATFFDMVKVGVVNLLLDKRSNKLPVVPGRVPSAPASPSEPRRWTNTVPSGHTMHAVAFSIVAVTHHPELGWLLVPFSSLIAMSRIVPRAGFISLDGFPNRQFCIRPAAISTAKPKFLARPVRARKHATREYCMT